MLPLYLSPVQLNTINIPHQIYLGCTSSFCCSASQQHTGYPDIQLAMLPSKAGPPLVQRNCETIVPGCNPTSPHCTCLFAREKGHPEALTTREYALSWLPALRIVLRRQWTLTLRDRGLIIGRYIPHSAGEAKADPLPPHFLPNLDTGVTQWEAWVDHERVLLNHAQPSCLCGLFSHHTQLV